MGGIRKTKSREDYSLHGLLFPFLRFTSNCAAA